MSDPSLVRFRVAVEAALQALEARRSEINDLNVFPVADGDTGDNMALTLSAVLGELNRLAQLDSGQTLDDIGRSEIVDSVARAALLGARGNSGVILSQLIRGAAEELVSRPGELVDPVLVGAAMARAASRAYQSVREPAEGTILTVAREMSERIASELAHTPREQQDRAGDADRQDEMLSGILEIAVRAGEDSAHRGRDLLPVLRDAGVVDAGGYGLLVILTGVIAALRGTTPPVLGHHAAPARPSHPQHASATYRYCTNFAVTGEGLDAAAFRARLEALGDSVLVVGEGTTLKVHVHTDDPDAATAAFADAGRVSHLDVADMHEQMAGRASRLAVLDGAAPPVEATRCAALAVVGGPGLQRMYASLEVQALDAGPTLNPSTYDLLAAIHALPAEEVVVLPNSSNVFMAAERAAQLSDRTVQVVPTRSQQAGLVAAVALEPSRGAQDNAAAIQRALEALHTGAVAPAARDDRQGRFRRGDAVGFLDEQLTVWGSPEHVLREVLRALDGGDAELLTCIAGDDVPLAEADVRALVGDGVELEYRDGGPPRWWWLLTAE
jgi:DAK2 domain fusion protein YloV